MPTLDILAVAISWAFGTLIGYHACRVALGRAASRLQVEPKAEKEKEIMAPRRGDLGRAFLVSQIVHYAKLYSVLTESEEKALELVEKRLVCDTKTVDLEDHGKLIVYEMPIPTVKPVA